MKKVSNVAIYNAQASILTEFNALKKWMHVNADLLQKLEEDLTKARIYRSTILIEVPKPLGWFSKIFRRKEWEERNEHIKDLAFVPPNSLQALLNYRCDRLNIFLYDAAEHLRSGNGWLYIPKRFSSDMSIDDHLKRLDLVAEQEQNYINRIMALKPEHNTYGRR